MNTLQKIRPFIWFESDGRKAAEFYTSVFPNSRIIRENEFVITFELDGQCFSILNGGTCEPFNERISFYVTCQDQNEVDTYWNRLLEGGGEELNCGWIKDKYGIFWQIIPSAFTKMINHPDVEKARKVMNTASTMKKLDIKKLEAAFAELEEIGVD